MKPVDSPTLLFHPANLVPFPTELTELNLPLRDMNATASIPTLEQFSLHAIDQVCLSKGHSQLSFSVELAHDQITQRVLLALLDENRQRGACVAIYPATGEVCDLTNGGGVIGYLSLSPLFPGQSIHCELLIYKFGPNCVCTARVCGETFLYPAFVMDGRPRLTALVGYDSGAGIQWEEEMLRVTETQQAAVA